MYFSRSTYAFFDSFVNFSFLSGFYSMGYSSWKMLLLYCKIGECATASMREYIWDDNIAVGKVYISQSSGRFFGYFAIGIVYHTISVVAKLLLRWHAERVTYASHVG